MGRLVVEDVLLAGVGITPFVGGTRVRLLLLGLFVVVVLLSRFLFGLRLDPKEAPNCLNREFIRTNSFVTDPRWKDAGFPGKRVGEDGRWRYYM